MTNNIFNEKFRHSLGIPEDLWKETVKLYEKYGIEYVESNTSFMEFYQKIFFMFSQCAANEEELNVMLEFLWYLFCHREYLITNGLVYEDYYDESIEFIQELIKINTSLGKGMISFYIKSIENKLDIEDIIASLFINKDFYDENEPILKDIPMTDYIKNAGKIFEKMLENYNEFTFKLAIFDLVVKFGYVIESYVKEISLFFLKGHCIKNNHLQKFYWVEEENERNKLTIGRVLKELRKYEKDFTLRMSNLRNAIFHSDFVINYESDKKERNIVFFNRNWKEQRNFKVLISEFYIICNIINTFNFALIKFLDLKEFKREFRKTFSKIKRMVN